MKVNVRMMKWALRQERQRDGTAKLVIEPRPLVGAYELGPMGIREALQSSVDARAEPKRP